MDGEYGLYGNPWTNADGSAKSIASNSSGTPGLDDILTFGLSSAFDLTGRKAAQTQFENQMFLDNSARQFSADEAAKQRAWEEYMSNTSVQRAMADIKAAGLNPWLALQNSSGLTASVPSGSSAQSSSGQSSMANNKLVVAAGLIATALRMFLTKGK